MQNLILIIATTIWLTVVLSYFLFVFAVYIKILSIALRAQSKEIISSFMPFWDFLYNFFLLMLLALFSLAIATMFYSLGYVLLKYSLVLMPVSFILGLFIKLKWVEKIITPEINFFGTSIPLSRAGGLHNYVIKWREKNGVTIFCNILKIISVWLLVIAVIFFILLELVFGNLTIKKF